MRWVFTACAAALAFTYYIGTRRMIQDTEVFSQGIESTIYVLTGRTPSGQIIETTIEEVENDVPYYLPPGLPKEEKDVMYS